MTATHPYDGAELVAVLPSADLDRAELWYGRLGFETVARYSDYLILGAGQVHLHLRHTADVDPTRSQSGVYLYVASADVARQLHVAWGVAGVRLLSEPLEQPYGLVEFAAEDLDGNLWRVGGPLEVGSTSHEQTGAIDASAAPVSDTTEPTPEPDWFAIVSLGRCDQCGLDTGDGTAASVGGRIRDEAHRWAALLRPADDDIVRRRPASTTWSALEYAVHVRDVLAVFTERVMRTLAETDPELGWWDHEAAIEDGFANESDRDAVAEDLLENANRLADALGQVSGDQWERSGLRASGERFTIELLARFGWHETAHHRHDAEESMRTEP